LQFYDPKGNQVGPFAEKRQKTAIFGVIYVLLSEGYFGHISLSLRCFEPKFAYVDPLVMCEATMHLVFSKIIGAYDQWGTPKCWFFMIKCVSSRYVLKTLLCRQKCILSISPFHWCVLSPFLDMMTQN